MKEEDYVHKEKQPSRIAFGSCNSQELDQPLWPIISSRNVSAFVWGGDAIYADTFQKKFGGLIRTRVYATPVSLQQLYEQQLSNKGYQQLLQRNITIFGTIDDHDYGCNNGDRTYKYSKESGLAFLNFTNEPKKSPIYRRAKKGLGVYGVKIFDFERAKGSHLVPDEEAMIDPDVDVLAMDNSFKYSKKSVAIFVLDVRTNKTPWSSGRERYKPNKDGDFLGEKQWEWFETALSKSGASVNIILQGLQVHPERHPDSEIVETWDKFPTSQQRLYDTILKSGVEAPFLISGDVHMAQLLRKDCYPINAKSSLPSTYYRALMELTTSGMTHSWGTCFIPRRNYHTSWYATYAHFVSKTIMSFLHLVIPMPDLVISLFNLENEKAETFMKKKYHGSYLEHGGAEGSKRGKQFSLDLNFAELEFDWDKRELIGRVFGETLENPPLMSAKWSYDQLSGHSPFPPNSIDKIDDVWINHSPLLEPNQWLCVPVGGIENVHKVHFSRIVGFIFTIFIVSFPFLLVSFIFVFVTSRISLNKKTKYMQIKRKEKKTK